MFGKPNFNRMTSFAKINWTTRAENTADTVNQKKKLLEEDSKIDFSLCFSNYRNINDIIGICEKTFGQMI